MRYVHGQKIFVVFLSDHICKIPVLYLYNDTESIIQWLKKVQTGNLPFIDKVPVPPYTY